ncbi:MAG: BTAD domain-containing putative transcriptional regulator, partial [Acidimicrobiia bacterium]
MATDIEFRVLGPLAVVGSEGTPVALPGGRPGTVLAVLLVHANEAVSVDQLAEALWGDEPPPSAANALQAHVSKLRRAIGDRVSFTGAGYRLDLSDAVVDAHTFEALVAQGRALAAADDPAGATRVLGDALARWRGPAFADFADAEFARAERVRLDELRAGAIEDRIDYELELGQGAELVGELEALVVEHPLRERLRGQLMRALYRAGRQADALRAYQDARDTLVEELGIDPGPELRDLEAAILAQDASLTPRVPTSAVAPRARTNIHPPLTPLVGRTAELAAVRAELDGARLVTLVGPGGAGKTRLAVEAAPHQLAHHDDGVWMVELAGVLDPASITMAIAETLRIPDSPRFGDGEAPPLDRVAEFLAAKDMLLVLDNCEHVVTEVARLAEQFLARAPALRILATSREGLGLAGERLWPVPPLPVDDAIELFSQRAAGFADVVVAESDRDTVRDVCQR